MGTVEARDISGMVAAFALAAAAPLGQVLRRGSHRRVRAMESFAAGVSLAYVIVDLLVELTAVGAQHVHSTLPIGPTNERSLFAVVLVGATAWYVVGALTSRVGRRPLRHGAFLMPRVIYGLFVGGASGLEAEHGTRQLLLFELPMLLHLTVVESHTRRAFESRYTGALRVFAPLVGAAAWVFLGISEAVLFMALALVAGSTVVQIIQTELPSPAVARMGPFLLGVCVYSAMVAARWAGV